jgi:ABC-type molybdate transport system substrate-binding protein
MQQHVAWRWALGAAPKRSIAFEDSATGISSARAAGLYVAVVPSLPGAILDHDWLGTSLAAPELLHWARELGWPGDYPNTLLKNAPNAVAAKAFIALVRFAEGQKVLSAAGFLKP